MLKGDTSDQECRQQAVQQIPCETLSIREPHVSWLWTLQQNIHMKDVSDSIFTTSASKNVLYRHVFTCYTSASATT